MSRLLAVLALSLAALGPAAAEGGGDRGADNRAVRDSVYQFVQQQSSNRYDRDFTAAAPRYYYEPAPTRRGSRYYPR